MSLSGRVAKEPKKLMGTRSIKNFSSIHPLRGREKRTNEEIQCVPELLNELQVVLNERSNLQVECKLLKSEVSDLREKNDNLHKIIDKNDKKFAFNFNKLQDEIKANEHELIYNSKRCIQEQKKLSDEIKRLKAVNEKFKLQKAKDEIQYAETIKNLQCELKVAETNNENLKTQMGDNEEKTEKYKAKLRFAISVITELNNILVASTIKPEVATLSTQTNPDVFCMSLPEEGQECPHQHFEKCMEATTEDFLLSDIFFKPKSLCDSELMMINDY